MISSRWRAATGGVRALYARELPASESLRRDLRTSLQASVQAASPPPDRAYLLSGGHLFRYAVAPVYFGDAASGTLLGYVVNGYAIDTPYLATLSGQAGANGAFLSGDVVLASSVALPDPGTADALRAVAAGRAVPLRLGSEPYLAVSREFPAQPAAPLRLVFFKSLRGPEREIRDISRLLMVIGACTVLVGSAGMLLVARWFTRPLEALTQRVRAFGGSEAGPDAALQGGTREVRQLAVDFATMQARIEQSNRARLESERLATIGSMASSVSHDLRHYLASIYANAEFLSAADATEGERTEFLEDIRLAVLGTTEMLESLMIFGRTGQTVQHAPERLEALIRRAVTQLRTHPDAVGVTLAVHLAERETTVLADGRQLERAVYNLLLNGCQSARRRDGKALVRVELELFPGTVAVRVSDNGEGVPPAVQGTMFDPFVSEGKQNGTGLGLTLCRCIAKEHGGDVQLVSSSAELTVFELQLPVVAATAAVPERPLRSKLEV